MVSVSSLEQAFSNGNIIKFWNIINSEIQLLFYTCCSDGLTVQCWRKLVPFCAMLCLGSWCEEQDEWALFVCLRLCWRMSREFYHDTKSSAMSCCLHSSSDGVVGMCCQNEVCVVPFVASLSVCYLTRSMMMTGNSLTAPDLPGLSHSVETAPCGTWTCCAGTITTGPPSESAINCCCVLFI